MASQRVANIKKLWPDLNVSEADLKAPTTELVMTFFEKMLEEIALLEFAFEDRSSDQLLNQVSIKEGSRKGVVCLIFRHIFAKIKGPQFGIEDIIEPDAKRFGKQVDILLNLLGYLDFHFANVFNGVMEDMDTQSALKDNLLKEIDENTERRNQIAIESKALSVHLKSNVEHKAKYAAILAKVKGMSSTVTAKYNEHKEIYENLAAEESALKEAIQKGEEDIEGIKRNIILSPDAVCREKVKLMDRRKELEERHSAIKSMADEKNHFSLKLERLCSTMETFRRQFKDFEEKHTFLRNLKKGYLEDEVNLKLIKEKRETNEKKYESTKENLSKFMKETVRLEEQHAATCASLENDLLRAKESLEEAEKEQTEAGVKQKMVAKEIEIWKEKVASLDQQKEILKENFLEKKQQIENEVDEFTKNVEQKLDQMERKLGMPRNWSE